MHSLSEEAVLRDKIQAHRPGHALDRFFYQSPLVYEADLKKIWNESWLWAGHVSQLTTPGDYFTFSFGHESIIIVRDDDNEIRAHLNVCRHRGSRVCVDDAGNKSVFSCPYHGWTYQLNGSLRAGRAMPDGFDAKSHGLLPAHVIEYHGLLFVSLAKEPPAIGEALKQLTPALAPFKLNHTKVVATRRYPVNANWKLAVENYLECYHCAPSHKAYARSHSLQNPSDKHPELISEMIAKGAQVGLVNESISATGLDATPLGADIYLRRYPLYPGYDTGSESGKPLAPLLGELTGFDGGATDVQIGPVSFFLAYSDHVVGYRFLPRDIQHTDIEVVWMVRDNAIEDRDFNTDDLVWLWDITSKDDERIIRYNQSGVNSMHFVPGPLSIMEDSITSFYDWYLQVVA